MSPFPKGSASSGVKRNESVSKDPSANVKTKLNRHEIARLAQTYDADVGAPVPGNHPDGPAPAITALPGAPRTEEPESILTTAHPEGVAGERPMSWSQPGHPAHLAPALAPQPSGPERSKASDATHQHIANGLQHMLGTLSVASPSITTPRAPTPPAAAGTPAQKGTAPPSQVSANGTESSAVTAPGTPQVPPPHARASADTASERGVPHAADAGEPSTNKPATGAYRDLLTGAVVETDGDGNQAKPTTHPIFHPTSAAGPEASETPASADSHSIGARGLDAAAEFLKFERSPLLGERDAASAYDNGRMQGSVHADGDYPEGNWADDVGAQVTGFAVASSKRNADFHALFPSVPEDDFLIENYGCALSRDLLVQGRVYVSEAHLCFYSNIFGWVTSIVIPFAEIVSIEKRNTAYLIPNAIQVKTLQNKYLFASLVSRDLTYSMLVNIWRLSQPSATARKYAVLGFAEDPSDDEKVADGHAKDEKAADGHAKDEKAADSHAKDEKAPDGHAKGEKAPDGRAKGEKEADGHAKDEKAATEKRVPSGGTPPAVDRHGHLSKRQKLRRRLHKARQSAKKSSDAGDEAEGVAEMGPPHEGDAPTDESSDEEAAAEHAPTQCDCDEDGKHLHTVVLDETFPAKPRQLFTMLFVSDFMKRFWTESQHLTDLDVGEWHEEDANGEVQPYPTRSVSYVKPLNGPIGPKQTRCFITDEQLHMDFNDFCTTLTTTRTPDVPNGSIFLVKTRTCFMWAPGTQCRLYVTCAVDWTGRSMIKSIIDKASIEGQKGYYADLCDMLRKNLNNYVDEGGAVRAQADGADESETQAHASDTQARAPDTQPQAPAPGAGAARPPAAHKEEPASWLDTVESTTFSLADMLNTRPTVLILGALIAALLLSHVWIHFRGSAQALRDPLNPHRLVSRDHLLGGTGSTLSSAHGTDFLEGEIQRALDALVHSRQITEALESEIRMLRTVIQQQTEYHRRQFPQ
ncbi:hypothetical protein MSPP1_003389 [Malassezia sp. CBS 17886]|nr:hypothetical protein MSPP1_003389 [Malassezia sp. CBS 17886]